MCGHIGGHEGFFFEASPVIRVAVPVIAFALALSLTMRGRGGQRIVGAVFLSVYLVLLTPAFFL